MAPLFLQFPDGTVVPLNAGATHGRGTHASLVDSFLSRQHLSLTPVEGVQGVVTLTNLGRNRKYKGLIGLGRWGGCRQEECREV